MSETKSMMIAGVGGQGTLLASKILGNLFTQAGYEVKVSEIHGMSQRGGSVVTYVKWGGRVYSPLVDKGEADYLLAFELLEAARASQFLRPGGVLIASSQEILPMPVITGSAAYPQAVPQALAEACDRTIVVDALAAAQEAGSSRAANVVLLGVLSTVLDGFTPDQWQQALAASIRPQLLELNGRAFALGRRLAPTPTKEEQPT